MIIVMNCKFRFELMSYFVYFEFDLQNNEKVI